MAVDLDRDVSPAGAARSASGPSSVRRWWLAHRRSLLVLLPLLVIAGLAQAFNMSRFPMHIDDEGTYTSQAYAVTHFGTLGHYTFWYDHPPLGWLQFAGYTVVSDAFGRHGAAVDAGREFMLVVQLVACLLLWLVCRRLMLARWSSALAVVLFALSPLAIQFHRTVYLDNIATPWVLASFALALSPQKRLSAFVGSGLCLAAAVLTKETSLLLLPAVAVLLWRGTRNSASRRYALTLSAVAFVLGTGAYVLFSLIKGELLPGAGHVSLWDGVKFQLFSRTSSGSIFTHGTLSNQRLGDWLELDTVFPAVAVAATLVGLFQRRSRPVAIGLAFLLVVMLKPGYLPVPYVIAMLPLAAIVVAAVGDTAATWRPASWKTGRRTMFRRVPPALPAAVVVIAVALAVGGPQWTAKLRAAFQSNPNTAIAQSTAWVQRNVPHTDRLAVDDTYWLDLVRHGFPRDNVVWYYKMDTDPAVEKKSPNGWRDYDYLVLTQSVRSDPEGIGSLRTAIDNSVRVATFGTGIQRVDIRRTIPQGAAGLADVRGVAAQQRRTANADLLGNPRLTITSDERGILSRGRLDLRAANVLAVLGDTGAVQVATSPQEPGEAAAGLPARTLLVRGPSAADVRSVLAGMPRGESPATTTTRTDGAVQVIWPVTAVPVTTTF